MSPLHFLRTRVFQNTSCQNLFTEVAFSESFMLNNFINALQFAQRKLFRQ